MSKYQLTIAELWNIPIDNVRKLDKEIYVLHQENLQLYLRLGLKFKKVHHVLEFNQSQWLKLYANCNTQKRVEAEKNDGKDRKVQYKLMNNAVYSKSMEKLRNKIDIKLVRKEKDYLKWTSKPSHMSQKIFDNDLVTIHKIKVTLSLKNQHMLEYIYNRFELGIDV